VRKLLVFLGAFWVAANLTGAGFAVAHKRPYDLKFLDTPGSVDRVGHDFLAGWGTGLCMPLVVLCAAGIFTVVASFGHRSGMVGGFLLMLTGAASVAYTFCNELTYDRLGLGNTQTERGESATILAIIFLGCALVLFGFLTVITTPRHHRH
jgi:hypothetical protein